MSELTPREIELVSLGAALGSNCVPCIEYHVPKARQAGLTEAQIHAAIAQADRVRQVPARKVLEAALKLLPQAPAEPAGAGADPGCGCGSTGTDPGADTARADRTTATMATMMSRMMSSCQPGRGADA